MKDGKKKKSNFMKHMREDISESKEFVREDRKLTNNLKKLGKK